MILGTFNGTLYNFNDQWWRAKWWAYSGIGNTDDWKEILEAGYDYGKSQGGSYTRSILVCSEDMWNKKIKGTGFEHAWPGLCQLHYYHKSPTKGSFPSWAAEFNSYHTLLIHEYDDGKVAYLKSSDPLELYAFFDPVPPPTTEPPDTSNDDVSAENQPIVAGDYVIDLHITGTITLK